MTRRTRSDETGRHRPVKGRRKRVGSKPTYNEFNQMINVDYSVVETPDSVEVVSPVRTWLVNPKVISTVSSIGRAPACHVGGSGIETHTVRQISFKKWLTQQLIEYIIVA